MVRFIIIATALALAGCAREPKAPRPVIISFPKRTPGNSAPRLVGTVAVVNTEGGFVLVESASAPAPGTALKCIRDGAESGILAVSAERRRPFVVADIVMGTPQRGDQVFE